MDESRSTVREAVDFDGSFAEKLGAAVREKLGACRALVSEQVLEAAIGKVVEAAAARLDTPLAELLTGAWARYPDVQALCDARENASDQEIIAELAEHTFGWSYRPEIEIVVNESTSIPIPLGLQVSVKVLGGVLVVQGGRFKELRAGRLSVGAAMAVGGQEVARREKDVQLPRVLRFADGGPPARDGVPVGKIAPAQAQAVAASS